MFIQSRKGTKLGATLWEATPWIDYNPLDEAKNGYSGSNFRQIAGRSEVHYPCPSVRAAALRSKKIEDGQGGVEEA